MPKPPETEMLFEVELAVRCEKLEATNKELLDALVKTAEKLKEYADLDVDANGHGYGCICNPDEFISGTVGIAEQAITNAKQVMGDSDGK